MASAIERFTQDIARLTDQANTLRNERGRLQARQDEIDGLLAGIEGQTIDLAKTFAAVNSEATHGRAAPEDVKPVIVLDDEVDADITLTPRSTRSRLASPLLSPPPPPPGAQPSELDTIHPNYPTVVFLNGAWNEVWCGSCGKNVMERGDRFFEGVKGISHHGVKVHKAEDYSLQKVMATCGRRVLVDGEVAEMKAGRHPGVNVRRGAPLAKTQSAIPARARAGKSTSGTTRIAPGAGDNGSVSTVAPPVLAKLPARSPPAGTVDSTTSNAAIENGPTLYDQFQKVVAEARAPGTPKVRSKRRSAGRAKHIDAEGSDSEWEEQPLRKRFG